jgi:hypothetical protein
VIRGREIAGIDPSSCVSSGSGRNISSDDPSLAEVIRSLRHRPDLIAGAIRYLPDSPAAAAAYAPPTGVRTP